MKHAYPVITITWNKDERTIEYYRDRHHVAVFGFFEDGALVTWAHMWGHRNAICGRWPRRTTFAAAFDLMRNAADRLGRVRSRSQNPAKTLPPAGPPSV